MAAGTRLIRMEPIHDPYEPEAPSPGEVIRDVIETGREMFAAGQRLIHHLERLRGGAEDAEWRFEFSEHPYLWVAGAVGACLVVAAMLHTRREEP